MAVSDTTTISRTLIVLPGATWRAELEGELIRLDPVRAPISAGRVLGRICRHAGYLGCFQYDEADDTDVSEVGGSAHRVNSRQRKQSTTTARAMSSRPVAPVEERGGDG